MRRPLLAAALALALVPAATAAASKPAGQIVFTRTPPHGITSVWIMRADGTHLRRLAAGHSPSLSPDGHVVVYADDNAELRTVSAGGGRSHLLRGGGPFDLPRYSHNGRQIVYEDECCHVQGTIDVVTAHGRLVRSDIGNCALNCDAIQPDLAPDATRVVFIGDEDPQDSLQVFVIDVDGTHLTQLTRLGGGARTPSFSPDGRHILFVSPVAGKPQIFTMNADGSAMRRLSPDGFADFQARFSPDGRRIVFVSARSGHNQLYVMHADGSHQTRLTHDATADSQPSY